MAEPFKLALTQAPADLVGTRARLDWLAAQLHDVAGRGADLLLLPELFTTGYNIGTKLRDLAEPCDGPIAQSMVGLAQQYGVAIHYGYVESVDSLFFKWQCVCYRAATSK